MHPVLSDFRRLLWYVVTWLLTGILFARFLVTAGMSDWSYSLLLTLPVIFVFSFFATSAYYICRAFPVNQRPFYMAIAIFGSSALISGAILLGLCQGWNQVLALFTGSIYALQMTEYLNVLLLILGFTLYLLSLLAYDVLIAFHTMREAERRETNSKLAARDAELQVLRSQIDPHFLFNSLNSISALTVIDPAAAREMTIALADFFRKTLTLAEQEKVTLRAELELCEHFLAVEKIRFGNKLQTDIQLAADAADALVPGMLLQPLFENAIKHGIRHLRSGGTITMHILQHHGWLHIRTENPCTSNTSPATGNGLGLLNIRERLATLYGDQARVHWEKKEQQFILEIALPLELKQDEI